MQRLNYGDAVRCPAFQSCKKIRLLWDRRRVGEDEGTTAGIYILPSLEAAKSAHDVKWRYGVNERTGANQPLFRPFLLIDNEQRRVVEWAADGTARELETA